MDFKSEVVLVVNVAWSEFFEIGDYRTGILNGFQE